MKMLKAERTGLILGVPCQVVVQAAAMVLFFGVCLCWGQGTLDTATFTKGLTATATSVWTWVKLALQGGLFIWFAISLAKLVMSRDKTGDWWGLLYMLAGILALQYAKPLYEMVAGDKTGLGP
jgi:hypothetical protein